MDSQPLKQLVLVPDGTEASVTEGAPDLGGLEALDFGPGICVEARHGGPGLKYTSIIF